MFLVSLPVMYGEEFGGFSHKTSSHVYIFKFKKGDPKKDDLRGYVFDGLNVLRHLDIGFSIEFWYLGF